MYNNVSLSAKKIVLIIVYMHYYLWSLSHNFLTNLFLANFSKEILLLFQMYIVEKWIIWDDLMDLVLMNVHLLNSEAMLIWWLC